MALRILSNRTSGVRSWSTAMSAVVVQRRPGTGDHRQQRDVERTAKLATSAEDRIAAAGRRPLSDHGRPLPSLRAGSLPVANITAATLEVPLMRAQGPIQISTAFRVPDATLLGLRRRWV
jgi:hypothetical protein